MIGSFESGVEEEVLSRADFVERLRDTPYSSNEIHDEIDRWLEAYQTGNETLLSELVATLAQLRPQL